MNKLDRYIVLDTETSGVETETAEIIEFAYIVIEKENIVERFDIILKPENPVETFSLALTGIFQEQLDQGDDPKKILEEFKEKYGDYPIVGHNIEFDINILRRYISYDPIFYDTQKFAELIWPSMSSFSLESLCENLGIIRSGAHRALDDVISTFNLFQKETQHIEKLPLENQAIYYKLLEKDQKQSQIKDFFRNDELPNLDNFLNSIPQAQNPNKAAFEHSEKKIIEYTKTLEGRSLLMVNQDVYEQTSKDPDITEVLFPFQILSDEKFKTVLKNALTTNIETNHYFIGKLLSFYLTTSTGLKADMSMRGKDETSFWSNFVSENDDSVTNNPGYFWKLYIEKFNSSKICMAQFANLYMIDKDISSTFDRVIFYPVESAEREISNGSNIRLSLSELKQNEELYTNIIQLLEENPDILSFEKKFELLKYLDQLVESLDKNSPEYFYTSRFLQYSKNEHWVTSSYYYEVAENERQYYLNTTPRKPLDIYADVYIPKLISSSELTKPEKDLIKFFLGSTEISSMGSTQKPKIHIVDEAPSYGTPSFSERLVNFMVKETSTNTDIIYILSPGAAFASSFWTKWHLSGSSIPCVAEGVGGRNLNVEKIERLHEKGLVIVGGELLYKSLPTYIKDKISKVYYTKLQFPNTFTGVGKYRANLFSNSFYDYSMPHTLLMFRTFFQLIRKSDNTYPEMFITDSRVWEKDYGRELLKNFT